jgi:hypothetical protein
MKIYGDQSLIINQTGKNDKKNIGEKSDFQTIMDQITSNSVNKENNVSSSVQAPFIGNVGIVFKEDPVANSSGTYNKEDVLNNLKDTLDMVDFYAGKLADSSISSDKLSSIVDNLEERLGMLKDMESSSGTDDKLKGIISDLSTSMGMEIEKFKRGDYV